MNLCNRTNISRLRYFARGRLRHFLQAGLLALPLLMPTAVGAAEPEDGVDPDTARERAIKQYQRELAVMMERYKRYPTEAMARQHQGAVLVRMLVDPSGRARTVELVTSSGFVELDEQARITALKAKPFATIPPALRGVAFEARVKVIFDLGIANGGTNLGRMEARPAIAVP